MKLLFFLLTLPAFALPTLEEARERLGSTDAELRETTSLELWKNSQNSLPLLEKLAEDRNPEIRNRAHHILRRFKMGLTPESPKELLALAESLENATPDQFPTPLKALLAHDEGLPVALVIFNQWATRDLERNKLIAKNAAHATNRKKQ